MNYNSSKLDLLNLTAFGKMPTGRARDCFMIFISEINILINYRLDLKNLCLNSQSLMICMTLCVTKMLTAFGKLGILN